MSIDTNAIANRDDGLGGGICTADLCLRVGLLRHVATWYDGFQQRGAVAGDITRNGLS